MIQFESSLRKVLGVLIKLMQKMLNMILTGCTSEKMSINILKEKGSILDQDPSL